MAADGISGTTRLYGVLGDPVTQVRAPELLNPLLATLGVDAVVLPVHAAPGDLPDVLRGLRRVGNLDGLFVTVPHKAAVCRFADRLGPYATRIGTANVLRRDPDGGWTAENFDGTGFVRGLVADGHAVRDATVCLFGAGGAGSSIADALLAAGTARLLVRDVHPDRQAALLAALDAHWPGRASPGRDGDLASADIVVNATPSGLRPDDPLPLDPAVVRPTAVIADIIMRPAETALLASATRHGLRVHYGINMLLHQIPCYRNFFGWPES
ncbi:shikimate dehydrogenase family protein [Micromonospora cathayae]|uniref:Shikimate dehydrogenase n=1 Tax=Micromonospora cathayae TaxID=3028804 RepID=A0ABY7ZVX2_9ACTN|nr:shikimate dehydrogenase [Micromonospora sp. HUAS 3]WDZ86546.1 shikimate dehydrogenase [Micromonospora sp. HUAS 3]